MKVKIKKIHRININYLIPQLAIISIIGIIFYLLKIPNYWILAISFYLLLSVYLKIVIPKWHRKGLFYIKKGELEGAVFCFNKSLVFFSKNMWIDTFRAFTLLSLSKLSYREMALINLSWCYQQLGDKKKMKKTYQILEKEYPHHKKIYSL